MTAPAVRLRHVRHGYGAQLALDQVTLDIPSGGMVGLVGPDGVGKSTLLGLIAGAKALQDGGVEVLGGDMGDEKFRDAACHRIAYMPQGLGKNLYPDLTVVENIRFFSRLYGQSAAEGFARAQNLMAEVGLAPFAGRPASQLSGGMKQKLGLCCALIHDPEILILDEPTTGVDPLSRRQFWRLVDVLRGADADAPSTGAVGEGQSDRPTAGAVGLCRSDRPNTAGAVGEGQSERPTSAGAVGVCRSDRQKMTVLVATAYMEEAEKFDFLIVLNAGKILATGAPGEIKARTGAKTIEEAFVALLPDDQRARAQSLKIPPRADRDGPPVISARGLTKRFGAFVAVDHVDLDIGRGEIFGFLGSNGCGKTTTMKMLTGLLSPTSGSAMLLGENMAAGGVDQRRRVGYMSQNFSLYTELTVEQNLELHARLFQLDPLVARNRIEAFYTRFGLEKFRDALAADLPLGVRQRLALAVALVHGPELLILDEPTSGVDPLARDDFWRLLIELSREQGVTIFISTHFMNEAARCDRISLMDSGKILATGSPDELTRQKGAQNLEDAFIAFLEADAPAAKPAQAQSKLAPPVAPKKTGGFSVGRMMAYAIREVLELSRDPIRLSYAVLGPALLLLVLGFGITTDVDSLTYAVLDRDNSYFSRAYASEIRGSAYFLEQKPIVDAQDLAQRLKSGAVSATVEIPPGFGRDIARGRPTEVSVWIDGAMPYRAETIHGYLTGVHQQFLSDPAVRGLPASATSPANIDIRYRYNQDFDSIYAMVPGAIALQLALIPAILMALAVVREKELGSITNLYVTPVSRLEFLLGKQTPYVALAFIDFLIMFAMAIFIFQVPLKGGFLILAAASLLYVMATTAYGMMISSFTSTQIAAIFGTIILTILPASMFAGMTTPASAITGFGRILGALFPMTYYLPVSVGAFTKGLGVADLLGHVMILALFAPAFIAISWTLLRKQEK